MKPDVFLYVLKSISLSGVLLLLYIMFQRRENAFSFNRFFLLSSILLSIILPSIHFDAFHLLGNNISDYSILREPIIETAIKHQNIETSSKIDTPENIRQQNFNWYFIVYILMVAIFMARFIFNLNKILKSAQPNNFIIYKGYKVILLQQSLPPFSFLKYIFINQNDMESKDFESLLLHEAGHIKHLHSLDIIFIELMQVFLWFNPFLLFIKREIKLLHEYQADNYAVARLKNTNLYQSALINQVFRNNHMILASGFNTIFTKKRLKMINRNDSNFISKFIKKSITLSVTLSIAFLLISFNNAEKSNTSLKQSSLMSSGFEAVELTGQLIFNYPGSPKINIPKTSDYKVLELLDNGKVCLKITNYGNNVLLVEKEVQKLDDNYDFVLKDLNDKIFHGKIDVIQNHEPDIKYYVMYNGSFRRTLKMYDYMAFEGNYPARKLQYIINNENHRTENFNLLSSKIEDIKINYLGKEANVWEIKINTEQESFATIDNKRKNRETLKEKFRNSNLAINIALSKPPKKRKDWEYTEYFHQDSPGKNIEFHRNGAKVIVKNDKVDFMDDGYFKTGPFLVKLEKDKLIVNCKQNTGNLTMNSDDLIKKSNQAIQLKGNSELALSDEFIFNANEILVISN